MPSRFDPFAKAMLRFENYWIRLHMNTTHSAHPHRELMVDGVTLRLAQPLESSQEWIGSREILTQLLACWLVIDERDLPLSPRITGPPGIGKTTLAMSGARE